MENNTRIALGLILSIGSSDGKIEIHVTGYNTYIRNKEIKSKPKGSNIRKRNDMTIAIVQLAPTALSIWTRPSSACRLSLPHWLPMAPAAQGQSPGASFLLYTLKAATAAAVCIHPLVQSRHPRPLVCTQRNTRHPLCVSPSRVASISPVSARVGASTPSLRTFFFPPPSLLLSPWIHKHLLSLSSRVLKIHHLHFNRRSVNRVYTSASESIVIDYRFRYAGGAQFGLQQSADVGDVVVIRARFIVSFFSPTALLPCFFATDSVHFHVNRLLFLIG